MLPVLGSRQLMGCPFTASFIAWGKVKHSSKEGDGNESYPSLSFLCSLFAEATRSHFRLPPTFCDGCDKLPLGFWLCVRLDALHTHS